MTKHVCTVLEETHISKSQVYLLRAGEMHAVLERSVVLKVYIFSSEPSDD